MMSKLQVFLRILPSILLFAVTMVKVIFDLDSIDWIRYLQIFLYGATIWQLCCAVSSLLRLGVEE